MGKSSNNLDKSFDNNNENIKTSKDFRKSKYQIYL